MLSFLILLPTSAHCAPVIFQAYPTLFHIFPTSPFFPNKPTNGVATNATAVVTAEATVKTIALQKENIEEKRPPYYFFYYYIYVS